MMCGITELRCKEVVNINDGGCLGCVSDVQIDTCTAKAVAIVIFGRAKFFGLFGREPDTVIDWDCIECIGEDAVLVKYCCPAGCINRRRVGIFDRLLG